MWSHTGWDLGSQRTTALKEGLLRCHANLFMNVKSDRAEAPANSPFAGPEALQPTWLDLLPADISSRIESENARRVYRLPIN